MNEKRLQEIMARKAEIKAEMEGADLEQLRALNTELDALVKEAEELTERNKLVDKLGKEVAKPESRNGESETEKRGRELKQGRSVTVATEGVLLKKHTADTINPTFNEVSTLIDAVATLTLPGGESYDQPYEKSGGEGDYTNEGAAAHETEPTFGYATIKKSKITAYTEMTEETEKLPEADYARVVLASVPKAIRKKITKEILVGDGTTNHLVGICDDGAKAIDASTDIAIDAIDENTLDEILLSYGGDEDVEDEAVLIMNKKLLKAFMKVKGADKKKVYEIKAKGNRGTINGTPYILNSALKDIVGASANDYLMVYGHPSNYQLTIFSELEVDKSKHQKFKEGVIAHRGVVFVGGNVVAHNGFIRVKKQS